MNNKILNNLTKMRRISQFTIETLITDFGMYESAIIDYGKIQLFTDDNPRIEVSPDIAFLQEFLVSEKAVLLPCYECQRVLAFTPQVFINPQGDDIDKYLKDKKVSSSHKLAHNTDYYQERNILISKLHFSMSNKIIANLNYDDVSMMKAFDAEKILITAGALLCRDYLLDFCSEVRRDYICTLDKKHRMFVNFVITNPFENWDMTCCASEEDKMMFEQFKYSLIIRKVGQSPSLADLQFFDVGKYRGVLDRNSYSDLTRAIGLNADGIGCGAFLYLRRIFENLVEDAHLKLKNEKSGWDEERYQKSHFDEKIDYIEESGTMIIPDVLKQFKTQIYGVLSKGVHESSDNECMELFPQMKFIIEQLLEEQIRQKEMNLKIKKLQETINILTK